MKRLIALAFLVLCLALPVLAGDTEGPGKSCQQNCGAPVQNLENPLLAALIELLLKLKG